MGFLEALLLSLALCVDSLVVSAATAFRNHLSLRRSFLLALIFGFCQGIFPLLGALIGDVARAFIESVDHWIAFALLAFIGGKMIWDGIGTKSRQSGDEASHTSSGDTPLHFLLMGIATSIDAFAVGIGLGLQHPMATVIWVVLMIGVVTLLISLLGSYLGNRRVPVPERTANILAGSVLIALGIKILVEHLLF